MNVGAATSTYSSQALQRMPEAREVKGAADNDGDSDDGGTKAIKAASAPTVNTSGQAVGTLINAVA
jgi:hypothetical protein